MSGTSPTPAPANGEPAWAKPGIGVYSLTLFVIGLGVAWWANDRTALDLMIGAVISNATTVVGYYFGSSAGSAAKTALMGATPPPAAPAAPQGPTT